jgi:hypothetical protein
LAVVLPMELILLVVALPATDPKMGAVRTRISTAERPRTSAGAAGGMLDQNDWPADTQKAATDGC